MSRRRPRHDRRRPRTAQIEVPAPPEGRDVRVELAGHTVRLEELRARPERYARWFAQARRSPGYARCRCSDRGERLVIREVAGRFHLARWPSTRGHSPRCPFFSAVDSADSGAAAAHRAAITVTEHGTRIAVDYAFTAALPHDDNEALPDEVADPVPELVGGARPSTATMTGLALLHWLWEAASLNCWDPALLRRRRLGRCPHRAGRRAGRAASRCPPGAVAVPRRRPLPPRPARPGPRGPPRRVPAPARAPRTHRDPRRPAPRADPPPAPPSAADRGAQGPHPHRARPPARAAPLPAPGVPDRRAARRSDPAGSRPRSPSAADPTPAESCSP